VGLLLLSVFFLATGDVEVELFWRLGVAAQD
jgi:hypothetical protein